MVLQDQCFQLHKECNTLKFQLNLFFFVKISHHFENYKLALIHFQRLIRNAFISKADSNIEYK